MRPSRNGQQKRNNRANPTRTRAAVALHRTKPPLIDHATPTMLHQGNPMTSITIPSEAVDAYDKDGAVCLIVDPPKDLQPQQWREWAEDVSVLPVEDVEPIIENGRRLAKIIIGDWWTKDNNPPQVFHLCSEAGSQAAPSTDFETISIRIEPGGCKKRPQISTRMPPRSQSTGTQARRCTCPVRVWPETHTIAKALAAQEGLEIAAIIGKAVDAYMKA